MLSLCPLALFPKPTTRTIYTQQNPVCHPCELLLWVHYSMGMSVRANILRFLLLSIPSVILGSITNLYCFYSHIFWSVSLIRYCYLDIGILIYWCQACASLYFILSSSNTPKNSHNRAFSSFSAYSAKGCYLLLPLSTLCSVLPSGYRPS